MKYIVEIKEISYASVEVDAESEEEAEENAMSVYYNGNCFWGDCDVEVTDVHPEF